MAMLTLEESLACVFFEEGFMGDWAGQIIDHELKDWFNFVLTVAGVVRKGYILA